MFMITMQHAFQTHHLPETTILQIDLELIFSNKMQCFQNVLILVLPFSNIRIDWVSKNPCEKGTYHVYRVLM